MSNELEENIRQEMLHHDADVTANPWQVPKRSEATPQPTTKSRGRKLSKVTMPALAALGVLIAAGSLTLLLTRSTTPVGRPSNTSQAASASLSSNLVATSREGNWWSAPGAVLTTQTQPISCGERMPNFTMLGPNEVRLTFGDQSPTNPNVHVLVKNLTDTTYDSLSTNADVVLLDPSTLNVVGIGGDDLMERPYSDLRVGDQLSIHYVPNPRDCSTEPSARLADGRYPAFIRVEARGTVKIFLIPAVATVDGGSATLSPPPGG